MDQRVDSFGCFHIGYDPDGLFPGGRADEIYTQVDIGNELPGAGLPGAARPTVMGHFSVHRGANRLRYRPAFGGPDTIFTPDDNMRIFTIPNGGFYSSSVFVPANARGYPTTPWHVAKRGPLVAYVRYISGSEVDLFTDPGCTAPAFPAHDVAEEPPQFILRGSPRIYPGIGGIAAHPDQETHIRMWCYDDQVGFVWQNDESRAFTSIAVKCGLPYPLIFLANGEPDIGLAGNFLTRPHGPDDLPDFAIGRHPLNAPTDLDEDLLGTAWGNGSIWPGGGSGGNHPGTGMNRIWRRVIDAVDLRIS